MKFLSKKKSNKGNLFFSILMMVLLTGFMTGCGNDGGSGGPAPVAPAVTLSGITLSEPADTATLTLSPVFQADHEDYELEIENTVTSIAIIPVASQAADVIIKIEDDEVESGNKSSDYTMIEGSNTITIIVTAKNDTASKTYTITVNKLAAGQQSSNADLSNLACSTGTMSPAIFEPDTLSYTLTIPGSVTSVDVTPTSAVPTSSIEIEGTSVNSESSHALNGFSLGNNSYSVIVTAEDGATKTYTLNIYKQNNNADLTSLAITESVLEMNPSAFETGESSYAVTVGNSTTGLTFTPTLDGSSFNATITVNGDAVTSGSSKVINLNVGTNNIPVVITSEDGATTKTYTYAVTRYDTIKVNITFNGALKPVENDTLYVGMFNTKSSIIAATPAPSTTYDKILTQSDIDNGFSFNVDKVPGQTAAYISLMVDKDGSGVAPSNGDLLEFYNNKSTEQVVLWASDLGGLAPDNVQSLSEIDVNLDKAYADVVSGGSWRAVNVAVSFSGTKPDAGETLIVAGFYSSGAIAGILTGGTEDAGYLCTLTDYQINNGVSIPLFVNAAETTLYIAVFVDKNGNDAPDPGEQVEFFDNSYAGAVMAWSQNNSIGDAPTNAYQLTDISCAVDGVFPYISYTVNSSVTPIFAAGGGVGGGGSSVVDIDFSTGFTGSNISLFIGGTTVGNHFGVATIVYDSTTYYADQYNYFGNGAVGSISINISSFGSAWQPIVGTFSGTFVDPVTSNSISVTNGSFSAIHQE